MTVTADEAYGATIAKWRLALLLAELRRDRGLTASQVCAGLGWGRGKLGRFEMNQWKRPELSDIRDLLRLYQVGRNERNRITELALLARRRPWWRDYGDVFSTEYPGFENDAQQIRIYLPLLVPELFQTPRYAQTHADPICQSPHWRRRFVEATVARQRILLRTGRTAPSVAAVITEAALRYNWGTRDERREQIVRLAELAARPTFEIRLHPFAAGPQPEPPGPVCQLRFGSGDADLIFVDAGRAMTLVTDPEHAKAHAERLARALRRSWDPVATVAHLTWMAESLG